MYVPESPTAHSLDTLAEWVAREFRKVSIAFAEGMVASQMYDVLHSAPPRPRDGLIVFADGTDWNPGDGAGLYEYVGGTWRRLFVDVSTLSSDVAGLLTDVAGLLAREGLYQGSGCRLSLDSATSLVLKPYTTPYVSIYDGTKWTFAVIPQSGISISTSGLSASTTYNVYIYLNSGTPTLELSTTNPALDGTRGVYVKTGDVTRFYLGAVRTNASTQFVDSETARLLYNHYNRIQKNVYAVNSGGAINLTTTGWTDTGISVTVLSPPVVGVYMTLSGATSGYNASTGTTLSCYIHSSVAGGGISSQSVATNTSTNAWINAHTHYSGLLAAGVTALNIYAIGWNATTILGTSYVSLRGTYYG